MRGGLYGLDQVIRRILIRSVRDEDLKSNTLDIDFAPGADLDPAVLGGYPNHS